jgi:hypothetical protein
MLWWCCNHLIAANAAALLQLGAKQGQEVYLAGQLPPSSPATTQEQRHTLHLPQLCDYSAMCALDANGELNIVFY